MYSVIRGRQEQFYLLKFGICKEILMSHWPILRPVFVNSVTNWLVWLLLLSSSGPGFGFTSPSWRRSFQRRNYWIINVDILFTVYFTAAEKNLLLTTLNSRYRSMMHSPSMPTKRIPEADIKFLDLVDSPKFGWYPFAIRLKSFERMLSDYLGKKWGYGCDELVRKHPVRKAK